MNLAALDLNLLVALEALLSEGHVGRAARRVGLSQPAASHALRRLRELLGDPLLVRVGAGMELTARAALLREPLDEALGRVRGLFADPTFDPATSARRFGLMMPDHVVDLLMPPLVERVAAAAPHVRLDVAPWRGPVQMSAELARSIDLVIACTAEAFAGFERQRLYSDRDALAVRRGHPARRTLGGWRGFAAAGCARWCRRSADSSTAPGEREPDPDPTALHHRASSLRLARPPTLHERFESASVHAPGNLNGSHCYAHRREPAGTNRLAPKSRFELFYWPCPVSIQRVSLGASSFPTM